MSSIKAQVSIYPLRQETLSPTIDQTLHIMQEHGLHVERGAMSSLITGHTTPIFAALEDAFRGASELGDVVMVITLSNALPVPDIVVQQTAD